MSTVRDAIDHRLAKDFREMYAYGQHSGRLDTLQQVLDILTEEKLYTTPAYSRIRKLVDEALAHKFKAEE